MPDVDITKGKSFWKATQNFFGIVCLQTNVRCIFFVYQMNVWFKNYILG